jgi:hypothetical protein
MVYYKMTGISVEHILLFVVIVCFINYFMGSSRCGFRVGASVGSPCTTQSGHHGTMQPSVFHPDRMTCVRGLTPAEIARIKAAGGNRF